MSASVSSSSSTKRAKCTFSNCPSGTSGFAGSIQPGAVFIESSSRRSSASREGVTVARTVNVDWGVMVLVEDLVSRRLVVRDPVHRVAELRELPVHPPPGPALVAERPVLGDAVPGVVGEPLAELDLGRRVELLAGKTQRRDRDPRREPLGPED